MPRLCQPLPEQIREVWEQLLAALAAGDRDRVMNFATAGAIDSLTADMRGWDPDRLEQLARTWRGWEVRLEEPGNAEGTLTVVMGPEGKEHRLRFRMIDERWKLDDWQAGL